MKKIKYIIPFLALFISFTSCDVDAESSDVITPDQTEGMELKLAKSYLSGAYLEIFSSDKLQTYYDDFGIKALLYATDVMVDDVAFSPTPPTLFSTDYQNNNRALSYRRPTSTWIQLYSFANAANLALTFLEPKYIDNASELSSEEELYLGQAYALRAYCYFLLINMYQQPYNVNKNALGVPMHTTTEVKPGRNTVAEVYEFILSDLSKAYSLLEDKDFTTASELNKYAVAGFYARALCFVNDYPNQWKEVAKWADIATQKGALMSNADLETYRFNTIANSEVIWGSAVDSETTTYWASFFPFIDPFCDGYTAGREVKISSDLYSKIDVTKDVRAKWFSAQEETVNGVKLPKFTSKKYVDRGGLTSDYIYMRTAEMHFLKAEALYNDGNKSGAKDALETIMKTRIPGYTTSKTDAALLEEIQIQKRIETWCEGVRLFDMKWRGEALDRTKSTNHITTYTQTLPANPKEWVYQIPDDEMDANDNITENNP